MDLIETNPQNSNRHPWEIARMTALKKILDRDLFNKKHTKILDIGCGDGFVSRSLFFQDKQISVTCLDINFISDQITELKILCPRFNYTNNYESIQKEQFDLILLLDVLEHEKDDRTLLKLITENLLANEGKLIIFAPAFPSFFGAHDLFLKHFRRYTRKGLLNLTKNLGLNQLASGYLFSLLLFPRMASTLIQSIFGPSLIKGKGIGNWNHNRMVTSLITFFLIMDNRLSLWLNKFQINIPGLTTWILCQKQPS
jgi:SAM-dependent methyltransferase